MLKHVLCVGETVWGIKLSTDLARYLLVSVQYTPSVLDVKELVSVQNTPSVLDVKELVSVQYTPNVLDVKE